MCGIIAHFRLSESVPELNQTDFLRARDIMKLRGPDAAGLWQSKCRRATLGHRRLAIIDLNSAADQPMTLKDGNLSIVFNGEIYNYRALRNNLSKEGFEFNTQSDTEVILQLYKKYGVDCVGYLRGMFAFAIWSEQEQSLFIARDPLGIKPIYYFDDGKEFAAASQVRALSCLFKNLNPNLAGHIGFFVNGYVPDPFTMFTEIKALPAGSWLLRTNAGRSVRKYYSISKVAHDTGMNVITRRDERKEYIREALKECVQAHMLADVDVGIFLSAGIDSTTIGYLTARDVGSHLRAVTLGAEAFKGTLNDEVPLAGKFAREVGLQHIVRYLQKQDFEGRVPELVSNMDQPSIDGVNTYFVSKLASEAGLKVVLSGLGGDELFRGYPSFTDIPKIVMLNNVAGKSPAFGRALRRLLAPHIGRFSSPKFASLLEFGASFEAAYFLRRALFLPWELRYEGHQAEFEAAWDEVSQEVFTSEIEPQASSGTKISILELTKYMRSQLLRDSDWAGMAWSTEIRVPFVDSVLIEKLAPLIFSDSGLRKSEVVEAIMPPLREEILGRPKTGFSLPIRDWLSGSSVGDQRGLRGWGEYIYSEWCQRHRCTPLLSATPY